LKQNFRAAMCHVLHYSCNVNAAVADSLHCRMICGTVPFSVSLSVTFVLYAESEKDLSLYGSCSFQ